MLFEFTPDLVTDKGGVYIIITISWPRNKPNLAFLVFGGFELADRFRLSFEDRDDPDYDHGHTDGLCG